MRALDLFFVVFHTTFIVLNVLGWIPRRVRPWNLAALVATAASWLGLGLVYGLGYCPLTDWHWRVLRALGRSNLPRSYTRYLVLRLFGSAPSGPVMDAITGWVFVVVFGISVVVNVRDRRRRRVGTHL